MSIRAFLYDSSGTDKEVALTAQVVTALHSKQLLWVDVHDFEEDELRQLAALLDLTRDSLFTLLQSEHRPRLDNYGNYSQFNLNAIQRTNGKYAVVEVDFILSSNLVVTVHRKPVAFLASFDQRIKGDSALGDLDAPSFLAALLDWHVTSYFRLVEELEKEVDKIDAHALQPQHSRDLLSELADLRQRVAFVRRILTPHREVYAGMTRPDFQTVVNSDSALHFQMLAERLDRAIEAVENARELLVGSFDMFTTQTTLRTNEVIKALTLVSFIWFPASVIVGITALLLRAPVNPATTPGFWLMLGSIALIGLLTLLFARLKRWI
jgi:magnesium transporter